MRTAALWFPDWPAQVADADVVEDAHRVVVSSRAARARGIYRGMRVREAQAVWPDVRVAPRDDDADGRTFDTIVEALDEVAASIEVIRPGLIVADVAAAGRFHGSEDRATEMLIDAASAAASLSGHGGIDVFAGVADEIQTAIIAARSAASTGSGAVVPPGQSREFLAPLSVMMACGASSPSDALPGTPRTELGEKLLQLGVRTLGELAALPSTAVTTRFGREGMALHAIASAAPDRRVAPAAPPPDLSVHMRPEEPISRVDEAAFAARQLAARLKEKLIAASKSCTRLEVIAELTNGEELHRTWRTREAMSDAAMADRVRWQLDGWCTARAGTAQENVAHANTADDAAGTGGIAAITLVPLEVIEPAAVGLDDEEEHGDTRRRAIERVQSTLGIEAVLQPVDVGGRGVAERIAMVPYGESLDSEDEGGERKGGVAKRSWPGQIPAPLPTRLVRPLSLSHPAPSHPAPSHLAPSHPAPSHPAPSHPAARVRLIDDRGRDVYVTAEVLLSGEPYAFSWGKRRFLVTAWAGPWPVIYPERVARLQVVAVEPSTAVEPEGEADAPASQPSAWLLIWAKGWRIEAVY